jgi:hypothetical protein|tara:strand:+ start:129 stop:629 length:501 start_codon:yes stop_codon:yes gene_type:complete
MANTRIKDLPISNPLIGTEAFIVDQRNSEFLTGFNTVQVAMSGLTDYILVGQPYMHITGDALIGGTLSAGNIEVFDNLTIGGISTFTGILTAESDILLAGDLTIEGDIIIGGDVDGRDIAADGVILDNLNSTAVRNISGVEFIQRLTQSQYNGLTPDPDTLYVIVG